MRLDQVVGKVVRVAGGIADALQPRHVRQLADQPGQAPFTPVRSLGAVGVHVLPEQRHLAHTVAGQRCRLGDHRRRRPAPLGASGVGHHAEGAELVATLLHGQERRRPGGVAFDRQRVELLVRREVRRQPLTPRPVRGGDQFRQAVIGLRPHHQVHHRRPRHDLRALGLGHAAGDDDGGVAAACLLLPPLHGLQPAELGVDLLRRLLADVAGVQHHQIGALGRVGGGVAQGAQHIGHALAVVDVHLAAVGLDEQPLGRGAQERCPVITRCGLTVATVSPPLGCVPDIGRP